MKAVVYHGPGKRAWEEVPDAAILNPPTSLPRVDTTTICGTDLAASSRVTFPRLKKGRILGHEAIGTITEVGSAVTDLKGWRPHHYSGGHETAASAHIDKDNKPSHCQTVGGVGWIFGYMIERHPG